MVLYIVVGDDMILYRDMGYQEYKKILHEEEIPVSLERLKYKENTFKYIQNVPYMHFFRYLEHAKMYVHIFGDFIVRCNVPDSLIEEAGYGFYQYRNFKVDAPIPELIIRRSEFLPEYMEGINPFKKNNSRDILGVDEVKLYHMFLRNLYLEWEKNNLYGDDEFAFCKYVMAYLEDKNIDDVLLDYCVDYLEKKGKCRLRKR